jgi:hypothetical protein
MATPTPPIRPAWQRRLRIVVFVVAGLVALFAVAGFFAVPPIARSKIEALAQAELGRRATVGKVEFNPFTLRARLSDFSLADRDAGRKLVSFETLEVNVSVASLWKRAPVLDAVRLVRPRLEIARGADGKLNIGDLIERALAPATGPEAAFAVFNIEIEDGSVVLDDAMRGHRTELSQLAIGIPFLSSLSADAQIRVTPHLKAIVDGAPFEIAGRSTSPFEDTQRAAIEIDLDDLPLPRYAEYAPLPGGIKLTDGALTTRLSLAFLSWKGTPRGITLTGTARLDRLAIARKDASPLAAARSVEVTLGQVNLLARSAEFDRIAVGEPELDLRRLRDGSLELGNLVAATAADSHASTAASAASAGAPASTGATPAPWEWSVREARVSGGTLRIADEAVSPPFRTTLTQATLAGAKLASRGAAGTLDVAFDAEGAHFAAHSEVDVAGSAARGRFDVTKLPLAKLHPYYASALAIDVRRGTLDAGADFDAAASPAVRFALANGSAALAGLDVALRGEREPLLRMASAGVDGLALDLGERTVTIGSVEARQAAVALLRDADGTMRLERVLPAGNEPATARDTGPGPGDASWHVTVGRLLLERFGVDFEDRGTNPPVKLRVADARVAAENLDTAPGARAKVDIAARVGPKGRVRIDGVVAARPASADVRIRATALDLVPLRPYVGSRTNVDVTSGMVGATGRITFNADGPAGAQARYVGDAAVTGFDSLDRPGSEELVRWETLNLAGIDVTSAPFNLSLREAALDGFYARLILHADATLNVLRLLAPETDAPASPTQTPAAQATPGAAAAEQPAPPGERGEIPASIGQIKLSRGEIEYSDFFVKPNYSAHLTELTGNVAGMAPTQSGAFELTGKVGGTAPVDIRGTLNPFSRELSLELTGKATGVDLPQLTPYSVKYAGYGIEKGKLSMEVRYKLDNRKLAASNKLVLDQLTFGEHVDSPTATKLPVLFVVSLLKDRNGVIHLDLPIEGTLDDPQFSIWGVVVQIIVNLLTKAVTAPFALLGAIVGGGGEQLSYVEFAPGSAVLTPAAIAKLETLAKALSDRPALKLDAAGRAIADVEGDALKRAALDRALRVRKQKDLASEGASAPALETLALDAADRAKYLKAVYGDTDLPGKPRNFLGFAKDIPPEQMEAMLLANHRVDDDALRELANHRAQAVRDWLAGKGNIPAERVFIVAPRLTAEGLKAEGAPARVDFAIR